MAEDRPDEHDGPAPQRRQAAHYLKEVKGLTGRDEQLAALVERDVERLRTRPEIRDAAPAQLRADLESVAEQRERVRHNADAAGKLNVRALALARLHEERMNATWGGDTGARPRPLPQNPPTQTNDAVQSAGIGSNVADRVVRFPPAPRAIDERSGAGSGELFVESPSGVLRRLEEPTMDREVTPSMILGEERAGAASRDAAFEAGVGFSGTPAPGQRTRSARPDLSGPTLVRGGCEKTEQDVIDATPVAFIKAVSRASLDADREATEPLAREAAQELDAPRGDVTRPMPYASILATVRSDIAGEQTLSEQTMPSAEVGISQRRRAGLITQPDISAHEASSSGVFQDARSDGSSEAG
ncbi:MAG: hypothetical protein Q8O67_31470 [Deltaproteobacteria bacterium]|nr:hypothetical protein [Deltaproteobacteria bacterium]